jgi:hypothetical protein
MSRPRDFLAWAVDTFGPIAAADMERTRRFVEEALELAHAMGLPLKSVVDFARAKAECALVRPATSSPRPWQDRLRTGMVGPRRRGVRPTASALILAPLSVGWQIAKEAERWGYDAALSANRRGEKPGINICNYDRLDNLDPALFGAVALGRKLDPEIFRRQNLSRADRGVRHHQFRLSATATPAPNDHMELGQQSDFLGVMPSSEMLMRWFINDTSVASQEWRLKRHAVNDFWDWCASWSRMAEMPSDLGGDDTGFILPEMQIIRHRAEASPIKGSDLFGMVDMSAIDVRRKKRKNAEHRAKEIAGSGFWDSRSRGWSGAIPIMRPTRSRRWCLTFPRSAARIRQSKRKHPARLCRWLGAHLLTKPSICGFGLNWQHCARTAFVGRTFSYEAWYQAVRRFWRFGQKRKSRCIWLWPRARKQSPA